jgi:hypothetical protein
MRAQRRGDHQPGGVGGELARGAVPQPDAGFEVADRELDRGVAAVILVQLDGGADSVGDQGVVAPVGEQLGLGACQAGAAHDQPVALVAGLGNLGQAAVGVADRCPGVLVDGGDRGADRLGLADGDGGADLGAAAGPDGLGRPEPRVHPHPQLPRRASPAHPCGELVDQAGRSCGRCWPGRCAGGRAAPRRCRPWWPAADDSRGCGCSRRRRPACGSRAPGTSWSQGPWSSARHRGQHQPPTRA